MKTIARVIVGVLMVLTGMYLLDVPVSDGGWQQARHYIGVVLILMASPTLFND